MLFSCLLFIPLLMFTLICFRRLGLRITTTIISLICVSSLALYWYFGYFQHARVWANEYQASYQLRQQFLAMGSLEDISRSLQNKLQKNPSDTKGWLLLAKLYKLQHRHEEATQAFAKAEENLKTD